MLRMYLVACVEGFDDGKVSAKPEEGSASQSRVGCSRTNTSGRHNQSTSYVPKSTQLTTLCTAPVMYRSKFSDDPSPGRNKNCPLITCKLRWVSAVASELQTIHVRFMSESKRTHGLVRSPSILSQW